MEHQNYQSSSDSTVALTLINYSDAAANFTQRYFLAGGSTNFIREFLVPWTSFNNAIQQFISVDNIPADRLALQFIHRYNPGSRSWFLCMAGGQLSALPVGRIDGNDLYDVTPGTIRFDLSNNTVAPSSFTGTYDPLYFNSFFYKDPYSGNLIPLSSDVNHTKFVGAVTMPWLAEVARLVTDNGANPGTQTLQLKFTCASFYYPQPSQLANVEWPHQAAITLVVNGSTCLDNIVYPEKLFKNKAADMSSNCPPLVNQYLLPAILGGLQCGDDDHGHGHGHGHGHSDDDGHGNGHGHGHHHGHEHEHEGDHDGHGHHGH
jgi:hypothetical protein